MGVDGKIYTCWDAELCSINEFWAPHEPGTTKPWALAWHLGDTPPSDCRLQGTAATGYSICQSELVKRENELTNNDYARQVLLDTFTLSEPEVTAISAGNSQNPENVQRVERLLAAVQARYVAADPTSEEATTHPFDYMFSPLESAVDGVRFRLDLDQYTYDRFLQGIGVYPAFCGTYLDGRNSDEICLNSLAMLVAHNGQEIGAHSENDVVPEWRQGMHHLREQTCDTEGSCPQYGKNSAECAPTAWQAKKWPCADGVSYYGRGMKQLSYNYNYGAFSQSLYGNVSVLLENPDKVAEGYLPMASAVYFFVTPRGAKPSMLHVVDGTWVPNESDLSRGIRPGFGATINVINGGVECGKSTDGKTEKDQAANRIQYYKGVTEYLGYNIPSTDVLGCKNQQVFNVEGSVPGIALDQESKWTPEWGHSVISCKVIKAETAFNIITPDDYTACMEHYYKNGAKDILTILPR